MALYAAWRLDIKISIDDNDLCTSVYYKPTDSHSYLLYLSSHLSHVKNSIPFSQFLRLRCLCSDDSNFSDSFSINVAILFLSFKRAITVPNKLIDSQHHKRLRRKTPRTAFHSLSHFTLTTTRLNLSFLKILNYPKTIQRLILSCRNPTYFIQTWQKHIGNFLVRCSFQTNDQSGTFNALTHDAKLVVSFIT